VLLSGPLSAFPRAVLVPELVTAVTAGGSGPSGVAMARQKNSRKSNAVCNLQFAMKDLINVSLGTLSLIFACFSNQR